MKKGIFIIAALAFITMSFVNPIEFGEKKFKVDVENSTVTWKGYKPTGSHNGTINLVDGDLKVKDGVVTAGSFTVDMSTIKDADGSARLEGHLKSADFFDIKVHAKSNFKITGSELKDGKNFITGDLTIKGITKEITFPAVITQGEETITLISEKILINRAEFNIKYKSKSFFNNLKEKFINDEFDLSVIIVAKL